MARAVRNDPALERQLLRKSVLALAAGVTRCADCGRTPLVGESVHLYDGRHVVCELCRMLRPEAPERSDVIRGSEHGHAVRITDRRAA